MDEEPISYYDEPGLATKDARVPRFLKWTYWTLPLWAIVWFILYWNGSTGWLDRGYWRQLQIAAGTTFPSENQNMPQDPTWDKDLGESDDLAE